MIRPLKVAVGLLAGAVMALGGGWAAPGDDRAALREQAQRYWEAQSQGDWATVYDIVTPEERGQATREEFAAYRKEKWPFSYRSVRLGDVEVAEQTGWVEVSYDVLLTLLPNRSPEAVKGWQIWTRQEDVWRPVSKDSKDQFPQLPPARRDAAAEQALRQRAADYWAAFQAGDGKRVYQYLEPAYQARAPLDFFLNRREYLTFRDHRLEWVEATGDTGRVKVTFTATVDDPSMRKLEPQPRTVIETWLKVDGAWYRQTLKEQQRRAPMTDEQPDPIDQQLQSGE